MAALDLATAEAGALFEGLYDLDVGSAGTADGAAVFVAGEMASRIGLHDWASTPLGPAGRWPGSLRAIVNLMLSSRLPMYIGWGRDLILLHNDAYSQILGARHPGALGQPLGDVWPEIWNTLGQGVADAIAGRATYAKDLPRLVRRNGYTERTFFTFSTSPLYDDDDRIGGIFCVCLETTDDVVAMSKSRQDSERLRELFSSAPSFMAVLRGPDHVFEIVNSPYERLVGRTDLIGRSMREALPELQPLGVYDCLDRVYASGRPWNGTRIPLWRRATPQQPEDDRFADIVYHPLRDALGRVSGIFIEGSDVTDAARAEQHRMEAERFTRATIDALSDFIAVINASGDILAVNRAWRDFAADNGAEPSAVSEGANYLGVCDRAAAAGIQDAADVAALIRNIAAGNRASATIDYQCHTATRDQWFSITITRFSGDGPVCLAVSHRNITQRVLSDQRAQYLATHDALTDLPNRVLLADRAGQAIEQARRSGRGLALLFIDLDNFKHLNDAFGHSAGDAALRAVAGALGRAVRAGDTVARLGGDEFVVLLTNLTDPAADAARLARAILSQISRPIDIEGRDATLTASIGISLCPADGDTLDGLLGQADAAMYAAKHLGRNGVQSYAASMNASAQDHLTIESDLRQALHGQELELYYQPQIRMDTGRMVGLEALVRWNHPALGTILPERFIPVAEESGLILPIGTWILEAACRANRAWQDAGLAAMPVSVNISPIQLRQGDFVDTVARILDASGLDPICLELEITENLMMDITDAMIDRLRRVKDLGVRLSIDDFGTGYSNLRGLKSLPLDRLKIDRSFVSDLPSDPHAAAIVRAIVAMAHSLGLDVLAEGVETSAQADFLAGLGCDQSQGHLYGMPLGAAGFEAWRRTAGLLPGEPATTS